MKPDTSTDIKHIYRPGHWRREPLVWMLILIPLSAVVGGMVSLYLAIVSNDGLVADDYYQRGKQINRILARDQAAAVHGLEGRIDFDPAGSRVSVELTAVPSYRPPQKIQLQLLHATRAGLDHTLMLTKGPNGLYAAGLPILQPGHWYIQLEADDWRLTGSLGITVPADPAAMNPTVQSIVLQSVNEPFAGKPAPTGDSWR